MAGFVSELLIDTPEVLAENPDPTHLDETVSQGRLAMIDVRDDRKIADMTQVAHSSTL